MEKVYTMQDWQNAGTFNAEIGQPVSNEVFNEFLNCVPPAYYGRGVMQVGEPYATDRETFRDLFTTFEHRAGVWYYVGACLYGKTENRPGLYC